jgi:hypothetical protein
MNPSLSWRPNQWVERRGFPFLLFFMVLILPAMLNRLGRDERKHITTLALQAVMRADRSLTPATRTVEGTNHYRGFGGRLPAISWNEDNRIQSRRSRFWQELNAVLET